MLIKYHVCLTDTDIRQAFDSLNDKSDSPLPAGFLPFCNRLHRATGKGLAEQAKITYCFCYKKIGESCPL